MSLMAYHAFISNAVFCKKIQLVVLIGLLPYMVISCTNDYSKKHLIHRCCIVYKPVKCKNSADGFNSIHFRYCLEFYSFPYNVLYGDRHVV